MADGRELELKLETEAASLEALRAHPLLRESGAGSKRTVSVYFDTGKGDLREAGVTLRVRSAGGRFVQTIKADRKAAAGLFDRAEWEAAVAGPEPELGLAQGTALEPLLAGGKLARRLRPVFESAVERQTWQIRYDGAEIEIIVDDGEVAAGKRRETIVEVELELKAGPAQALFAVARELHGVAPLRVGVLTKSERGARLASGRSRKVAKSEPLRLVRSMSAAEAFQAVAFACVRHFRLNEALAVQSRDPSALHQSRVALRRLRSALSMFRRLVADEKLPEFRNGFRSAAALLGEARDLDVFLQKNGDSLDRKAMKALKAQRELAYDRVAQMLGGAEFRTLMLEFVEWVATGPWTRSEGPPPLLREQPAREFAGSILDRHWKRVRRGALGLDKLEEEARHAVRIEAKKLRYATEFFAGLYDSPKRSVRHAAFLAALERLQDDLGDLNDLATGRLLGERMSSQAGVEIAPAAGAGGRPAGELLASAGKAASELDAIKPFWR